MIEPAMLTIEDKLKESGMSQKEIDYLMSRFLEEEAYLYVECMEASEKVYEKEVVH